MIHVPGSWRSCARAGIAASTPMNVFDAPSSSAKPTRKTPPVSVAIACVVSPSRWNARYLSCISAGIRRAFMSVAGKELKIRDPREEKMNVPMHRYLRETGALLHKEAAMLKRTHPHNVQIKMLENGAQTLLELARQAKKEGNILEGRSVDLSGVFRFHANDDDLDKAA